MPTMLIAVGKIESVGELRTFGEKNTKVTEFTLNDGTGAAHPCSAFGDLADKVPPPGTFVTISGRLRSRVAQSKAGATFTVTTVGVASIDPIAAAPAAAPAESMFGD